MRRRRTDSIHTCIKKMKMKISELMLQIKSQIEDVK